MSALKWHEAHTLAAAAAHDLAIETLTSWVHNTDPRHRYEMAATRIMPITAYRATTRDIAEWAFTAWLIDVARRLGLVEQPPAMFETTAPIP